MKLTHVEVENFLGAKRVHVPLTKRVNLFAGHNGAGKSSIQEAVRMALTGESVRVALKKDYGRLLSDGAEQGFIDIGIDDGAHTTASMVLPSGKGNYTGPAALGYVLDAQRFAHLPVNERRTFLFGLMGLKTDAASVSARLLKRGMSKERVERVGPLLRAGFDAAHKEAKSKATEAKGAWRAITGETYGNVKAESWTATVPAHDDSMPTLATELKHADAALEVWQQTIGKMQAAADTLAAFRAKVPLLTEHAAKADRIRAKLVKDEAELAEWNGKVAAAEAATGAGPRVGLVHELASALACTLFFVNEKHEFIGVWKAPLEAYERQFGKLDAAGTASSDTDAALKLPEMRRSRDLMASAVANDRRDLEASQAAKASLDVAADVIAVSSTDAELVNAKQQADAIKTQRTALTVKIDAARALKAQAQAAEKKTTDAAKHHADVTAWDALADALAPDGIPAEMLGEALDPINERLLQSAMDAEWPRVGVEADISITFDGRPYALLSESEKWRADAMLAEAISHLSGQKLLVLDRFDVLDLQGRSDLLAWLDILAGGAEIDTALIFGTLKSIPAQLPETIAAHWIENGVCSELKEAA